MNLPCLNLVMSGDTSFSLEKVYERSSKNLFWSIKNSGEVLDKLRARVFNETSMSPYDFSTLYTT